LDSPQLLPSAIKDQRSRGVKDRRLERLHFAWSQLQALSSYFTPCFCPRSPRYQQPVAGLLGLHWRLEPGNVTTPENARHSTAKTASQVYLNLTSLRVCKRIFFSISPFLGLHFLLHALSRVNTTITTEIPQQPQK
jgi:hypothetical protein